MRRILRAVLALAALVAAAVGFLWLRAASRPTFDYKPIARAAAIDTWHAPWPADPPSVGATATPRKWIVMGWDGASWDILLPLIEAGKLPHLAALMRGGTYGKLLTFTPTQSAAVWTSIATGVSPRRHGILGFAKTPTGLGAELASLLGQREAPTRLYSNADRRVKAVWNLASENGRKVMAVGYHNTFPAEKVNGLMVSNYLVRQATMAAIPGARAEGAEAAPHLAYPPAALKQIAPLNQRIEDLRWEDVRRFANVTQEAFDTRMERYRKSPHGDVRWSYIVRTYAYDTFHGRAVLALRSEYDPDFLFLHFQGPDWAGHHFLYFHEPERFASMPRAAEMRQRLDGEMPYYKGTVAAFYEYADEWLGKLLEGAEASTGVLVLSDHGMDPLDYYGQSGAHNDGPPGMFVASGPTIRRGRRLDGATVYDILPTLAAAAGLPVARDLDGNVLEGLFESGSLKPTYVASYEKGERYVPDVDLGAAFNREMEDELRSLGYIE